MQSSGQVSWQVGGQASGQVSGQSSRQSSRRPSIISPRPPFPLPRKPSGNQRRPPPILPPPGAAAAAVALVKKGSSRARSRACARAVRLTLWPCASGDGAGDDAQRLVGDVALERAARAAGICPVDVDERVAYALVQGHARVLAILNCVAARRVANVEAAALALVE
eukprot:354241-Chlamydomonas_euryale.AAC.4